MKLQNELVHLDFSPARDFIFSGYCIKQNAQIVVLNNFDTSSKRFDGFTVFRAKDISRYRYWTEEDIKKIKKDDRTEQSAQLDFEKMDSVYSCLQSLGSDKLVAVFTDNETDDYWVAKVAALTPEIATLELIDENGESLGEEKIALAQIDSLGFLTKYEKQLQKKVFSGR